MECRCAEIRPGQMVLLDSKEGAQKVLIFVTRAEAEPNENGVIYRRESLRNAVAKLKERIEDGLAIAFEGHPEKLRNAAGKVAGFNYLSNPAILKGLSIDFYEEESECPKYAKPLEVWSVAEFLKNKRAKELEAEARSNKLYPVSLRGWGGCEEMEEGLLCDIEVFDFYDVITVGEAATPGAAMKTLIDSKGEVMKTKTLTDWINSKMLKKMADLKLSWKQAYELMSTEEYADYWEADEIAIIKAAWKTMTGEDPDSEDKKESLTGEVDKTELIKQAVDKLMQGGLKEAESLRLALSALAMTEADIGIALEYFNSKLDAETQEFTDSTKKQESQEDKKDQKVITDTKPALKIIEKLPIHYQQFLDSQMAAERKKKQEQEIMDAIEKEAAAGGLSAEETKEVAEIVFAPVPFTDAVSQKAYRLGVLSREISRRTREPNFLQKAEAEVKAFIETETQGKGFTQEEIKALTDAVFSSNAIKDPVALRDYRLATVKREVGFRLETKRQKAFVDAKLQSMGYSNKSSLGRVVDESSIDRSFLDSVRPKLNDAIDANYRGFGLTTEEAAYRKHRMKTLTDTQFFKSTVDYLQQELLERINRREMLDAISTADVHSQSTVRQQYVAFNTMVIEQIFFLATCLEKLIQPLAPNQSMRPPVVGAVAAPEVKIGGYFTIPLEPIREDKAAVHQHYRVNSPAGAIPLVSTGLEHNIFTVLMRRAGAVIDDATYANVLKGQDYDLMARSAVNVALAIARSLDSEGYETMIYDALEHAVSFSGVEVVAETEWRYSPEGEVDGYGRSVVGSASLLCGNEAGKIKSSVNPAADAVYAAPLIYPRPKRNLNGLTFEVEERFPYKVDIILPEGEEAVEGFLSDGEIYPYREGEEPTHAFDCLRDTGPRIVFTEKSRVTQANRPTVSYFYSVNYKDWSKTVGELSMPFSAALSKREKAEQFINFTTEIAGKLGEVRKKYSNFVCLPFGYGTTIGFARTFEKQVSPTDAELLKGWGPGVTLGANAGIVYLKTNNERFPQIGLMGQMGSTFYGLGHVFGMTEPERLQISAGVNQLSRPAAATYRIWGQMDVFATPRFSDGRNFSYIVVMLRP